MAKLEYKTVVVSGKSTDELNVNMQSTLDKASKDGWEYVSSTPVYFSSDMSTPKPQEYVPPAMARGVLTKVQVVFKKSSTTT